MSKRNTDAGTRFCTRRQAVGQPPWPQTLLTETQVTQDVPHEHHRSENPESPTASGQYLWGTSLLWGITPASCPGSHLLRRRCHPLTPTLARHGVIDAKTPRPQGVVAA